MGRVYAFISITMTGSETVSKATNEQNLAKALADETCANVYRAYLARERLGGLWHVGIKMVERNAKPTSIGKLSPQSRNARLSGGLSGSRAQVILSIIHSYATWPLKSGNRALNSKVHCSNRSESIGFPASSHVIHHSNRR